MLNQEEIRNYCLTKRGVSEGLPFGDTALVFKVGSKIFLILDLLSQPTEFNVKCKPDFAIELRERYSSIVPGYHMNKTHWNTVICDHSLKRDLIYSLIDISYDLIISSLSKKMRETL